MKNPIDMLVRYLVTDRTLTTDLAADPARALEQRGLALAPAGVEMLEGIDANGLDRTLNDAEVSFC